MENLDEYLVNIESKNAKITDQYAVKGYYRNYDGITLLKHALVNTVPDISKCIGKDANNRDIKVRDSEAIQLANAKLMKSGMDSLIGYKINPRSSNNN